MRRSSASEAYLRAGVQSLKLQGDRHLLAQEDATAREDRVVAQPEVLTIDRASSDRATLVLPLPVLSAAAEGEVEGDRARDAADGEIAVDHEGASGRPHSGGDEIDRRVTLRVEEVPGPQ